MKIAKKIAIITVTVVAIIVAMSWLLKMYFASETPTEQTDFSAIGTIVVWSIVGIGVLAGLVVLIYLYRATMIAKIKAGVSRGSGLKRYCTKSVFVRLIIIAAIVVAIHVVGAMFYPGIWTEHFYPFIRSYDSTVVWGVIFLATATFFFCLFGKKEHVLKLLGWCTAVGGITLAGVAIVVLSRGVWKQVSSTSSTSTTPIASTVSGQSTIVQDGGIRFTLKQGETTTVELRPDRKFKLNSTQAVSILATKFNGVQVPIHYDPAVPADPKTPKPDLGGTQYLTFTALASSADVTVEYK